MTTPTESPKQLLDRQLKEWSSESRGIRKIRDAIDEMIEDLSTTEFDAPSDDWTEGEQEEYVDLLYYRLWNLIKG